MALTVQPIFDYVGHSLVQTLQQLVMMLGPILMLAFILHHLSRYVRTRAAAVLGTDVYTYFTAPGVMIHELGHAFFCVIFRHKIVSMQLFSPRPDGTLGSVQHAYNPKSAYQKIGNFFIGTGPIWFGITVICLLAWALPGKTASDLAGALTPSDSEAGWPAMAARIAWLSWHFFLSLLQPSLLSTWQFWLFAYLVFCIGSHITLSRSDIDGAARGFVSLVVFLLVFNMLTVWIGPRFLTRPTHWLLQASVVFYAASLFVIGLNLGLAAIAFVLYAASRRFR